MFYRSNIRRITQIILLLQQFYIATLQGYLLRSAPSSILVEQTVLKDSENENEWPIDICRSVVESPFQVTGPTTEKTW